MNGIEDTEIKNDVETYRVFWNKPLSKRGSFMKHWMDAQPGDKCIINKDTGEVANPYEPGSILVEKNGYIRLQMKAGKATKDDGVGILCDYLTPDYADNSYYLRGYRFSEAEHDGEIISLDLRVLEADMLLINRVTPYEEDLPLPNGGNIKDYPNWYIICANLVNLEALVQTCYYHVATEAPTQDNGFKYELSLDWNA